MTLGSCLYDHDFPFKGDAKRIIELRQQGVSWSKIGEEFGKSASGARSYFTKLTGSTEYKMKGEELAKLLKRQKLSGELDSVSPKISKAKVSKKAKEKPIEQDNMGGFSGGNVQAYKEMSSEQLDDLFFDLIDEYGNDFDQIVLRMRSAGASTKQISEYLNQELKRIEDTLKKLQKPKPKPSKPKPPKKDPIKSDPPKGPGGNKPPPPGRVYTEGNSSTWGTVDYPMLDPDAMLSMNVPLTSAERAALKQYTGHNYRAINRALRGGIENYQPIFGTEPSAERMRELIRDIHSAMNKTKTTRSMTVTRAMDMKGFQLGDLSMEDVKGLEGTVFRDKGFVSTSNNPNGSFSGSIRLIIRCPPGTKGVYVRNLSHYKDEMEFLLGDSQPMMINKVVMDHGGNRATVYATVLV